MNTETRLRDALEAYTAVGARDESWSTIERRAEAKLRARGRRRTIGSVTAVAAAAAVVVVAVAIVRHRRPEFEAGSAPSQGRTPAALAVDRDGELVEIATSDGRVIRTVAADPRWAVRDVQLATSEALAFLSTGDVCKATTQAIDRRSGKRVTEMAIAGHDVAPTRDGSKIAWVEGGIGCGVSIHVRDLRSGAHAEWRWQDDAIHAPDITQLSWFDDNTTIAFIEQGQEESPAGLMTLDTKTTRRSLAEAAVEVRGVDEVRSAAAYGRDVLVVPLTGDHAVIVNPRTGASEVAFSVPPLPRYVTAMRAADGAVIFSTVGFEENRLETVWTWSGSGDVHRVAEQFRAAGW